MRKQGVFFCLLCIVIMSELSACRKTENEKDSVKVEKSEAGKTEELTGRYSFTSAGEEFEVTIYGSTGEIIFSECYPKEPVINRVTDNIFEISISVGSPAAYVFYVDTESNEISETFFNPLYIGDCCVAYMEDGKLILRNIFNKDFLHVIIARDFTKTASPMSAIIAIEMQDMETVTLSYYMGESYEETTEILTIFK